MKTYPADKYALIMSDHGMGWPGGWSDPDPAAQARATRRWSQRLGNTLYLSELDDALAQIRRQTGVEKLELIGMDACLMSQLEVFTVLQPYARYAVASQETEPALGWAYTGLLGRAGQRTRHGRRQTGRSIVDTYIEEDQRIVDDQARAEF